MELLKQIDETVSFNEKNIRIIGSCEEPWFVAKDICNILDLPNITNAIKILPEKWRGLKLLTTFGGEQNMIIISEAGLYKLIMRSNKPVAQKFQEVVCEEILPSLRKKGEYKIQSIIDKNKELEQEKLKVLNENKKLEEEKKNKENELILKNKEIKQLHTLVKKKERKRYAYNHSVYIISNPDIKNSYKLGLTADRTHRLEALGPGAPRPYLIEYSRELCNATEEKAIESLLLGIFDKYRYETETKNGKQREWIQDIDLDILINEMDHLVDYYQQRKLFFTNKNKTEKEFTNNYEITSLTEQTKIILEESSSIESSSIESSSIETLSETSEESLTETSDESEKIENSDDDTPINYDAKICYVCKELKNLDNYYNRIENRDGKEGTCKKCYSHNKKVLKEEKDKREFIIRPEGTKKCRTCLQIKNFDNFSKHGTSKDGFEYSCIECKSQNAKNIEEKCCSGCKKTKKIINFETFRLGFSKYCKECEMKDEKYKQKELSDIKKCSLCEESKDIDNFSKCKTSTDGYYRYCRQCSTAKSKKYKETQKVKNKLKNILIKKQCGMCKIEKNTSENFHKNNITFDGYRKNCIECCSKIANNLRESKIF